MSNLVIHKERYFPFFNTDAHVSLRVLLQVYDVVRVNTFKVCYTWCLIFHIWVSINVVLNSIQSSYVL